MKLTPAKHTKFVFAYIDDPLFLIYICVCVCVCQAVYSLNVFNIEWFAEYTR